MRLAVDADPIGRDRSGNETYLRGIVRGLQALDHDAPELLLIGGVATDVAEVATGAATAVPTRSGIRHDALLGRRMSRLGADASLTQYNAPEGFRGVIATVVHDLSFLRVPETFPRLLRQRIAWSVRRSVKKSELIVTSSLFSRDELLSAYPRLRPDDVVVTYSAADAEFSRARTAAEIDSVRNKFRAPDVFVLAVGNLQPRKNLVRLAGAVRRLDVPLLVAGRPTWKSASVVTEAAESGVRWLGYVSKTELAALYRLATVFAYPSLYEGFGLPVVEAMASGTPVVTSDRSSLPEVAGDAAVFVDPYSEDAIAQGIAEVLDDSQKQLSLGERGRARAAQFSWVHSADALNAAIRDRVVGRS